MEEKTTTTITAVKEEFRLCDWAAQIAAQQASGMTVQKWCGENGINPKTYASFHRTTQTFSSSSKAFVYEITARRSLSSEVLEIALRRREESAGIRSISARFGFLPTRVPTFAGSA